MDYRIGIDIGGTFTDFTLVNADDIRVSKTLTTAPDPLVGVAHGLAQIAQELQLSTNDLLSSTSLVVHGTTVATNAVLQRRGPRVGLLATHGFRDVLIIRDGYKPDRYNLRMHPPRPFVPRDLCLPIVERISSRGEVLRDLDEESVRDAGSRLLEADVVSVAIAFLWSSVNPVHELRAAEILRDEYPDLDTVISSDIVETIGEWPRTSATVLSAFIRPIISEYLDEFAAVLGTGSNSPTLLVMQINGGTAPPERVRAKPVYALHSGPAAGPAAAAYYGESLTADHSIVVDMGGTSFDVSIVDSGQAVVSTDVRVEEHPIAVPALDVHSIGAGGGSIASIDKGGALRVGPESAGSDPGPACYARGGESPTVTDANLVLGYLSPARSFGGEVTLDSERASQAIESRIATPLGITLQRAALGIVRVVNNAMVHGIRAMTIARGRDPREYSLIVGGGAGPLHAAALADELAIARVIIPKTAGVFCAIGMVFTDVKHDFVRSHPTASDRLYREDIARLYHEMRSEALKEMRAAGIDDSDVSIVHEVDAKYTNQVHQITYPIPEEEDVLTFVDGFNDAHERMYGYSLPGTTVEFYNWRLTATGRLPAPSRSQRDEGDPDPTSARIGARSILIDEATGPLESVVYDGDGLAAGMIIRGPAIIEELTTTILVPTDFVVRVNRFGDYMLGRMAS